MYFLGKKVGQLEIVGFSKYSHIWPPLVAIFLALRVWESTGAIQDDKYFEMVIIRKEWQYSEGMTLIWKDWQKSRRNDSSMEGMT